MIPLIYGKENSFLIVKKIVLDKKTKRHLENLGILVGSQINLITSYNGDVILKVKDGRLAISKNLATKIFVE